MSILSRKFMDTNISLKGISRIDSGSTHGWFVRAYRNNKTYSKLISDSKFESKEHALKEAIKVRDQFNKQIAKITKRPSKRRIVKSDSRNLTGELGVSRTSKKAVNGNYYESYTVSWRPKPGVQKSTSFSIRKFGDEKALKMAIEHRRKMMKKIHGDDFYKQSD
jgi:hypothetical protein